MINRALYFFLLIAWLLPAIPAVGQPVKGGRQQPHYKVLLKQVQPFLNAKPEKAIGMLEEVIRQSRAAGDKQAEAESYFLLGNIYEKIKQETLALQRYRQAELLLQQQPATVLRARNLQQMGQLQLSLGQLAAARQSFTRCQLYSKDGLILNRCREGLAEVAVAEGQYSQGLRIYDTLQGIYQQKKDSVSVARVEAQRSQLYLSQQDLPRAREAFSNSLKNLPQQLEEQDYQPIRSAKKALEAESQDEEEIITLNLNTLSNQQMRQAPTESIIEEQLQLADLYLGKGDIVSAERYVDASKASLADAVAPVAPEQRASVFKKASELSLRKGAYEEAVAEYQQYIEENEKVLSQKQEELNQQLAILKSQRNIDLLIKDLAMEESERAFLKSRIRSQQLLIGLLCLLLLAALASFYYIMKNVRSRRRANQLLLLKSLRTQMNPHFIFNALNSVNNFISRNDERAANKFLADFARLMRLVLNNSQKDFIALEEELELLRLYLKLEQLRFRDKFDYELTVSPEVPLAAVSLPPMLVQPFVENAVWHGLRYKKEKGKLQISVEKQGQEVVVIIADDGIGRSRSRVLKTKNQATYKSTGLDNVNRRIATLNELYHKRYELRIENLDDEQEDPGTLVTLKIPI